MQLTNGDQLAKLRAINGSEVVISEPVVTGTPGVLWASLAAAVIAIVLAGGWLVRRTRPRLPGGH